jgi:tetratricopeptide (TPR) repeat protein
MKNRQYIQNEIDDRLWQGILGLLVWLSFLLFPSYAICHSIDEAGELFLDRQYEKSIELYLSILKSPDRNPEVNYRIGLSHFMLGNLKEALKYWVEAKKQNPDIFKGRTFKITSSGMEPQLISLLSIMSITDVEKSSGSMWLHFSTLRIRSVFISRG